ncbi:hypothetical protein RA178_09275 [Shewanella oncorhynchi]|uniref:Uncharacterized protein n=1 Tax=Shewanella oncorhynchi TaxID=2726434 RepID=A0AA50KH40_9GAMM|nr:hypothetical protein [Shewanella oncorhynchi]WMB74763.1 hypothetical protein RA178_09275 [Shewanella oncorhynchi]
MIIGNPHARFAYYLPTAPQVPESWHYTQPDAVGALIALNGNHWRKIFTIMAKISAVGEDWRSYRDQVLLKQNELICIGGTELMANAKIHLIAGQVAANALGLTMSVNDSGTQHLTAQNKSIAALQLPSSLGQHCLLTPYLDYRQYPNQLIALTRQHLATPEHQHSE